MRTCHYCGVEILDPINICPLCHCITNEDDPAGTPEQMPEPAYPYADQKRRRGMLVLRTYIAAAVGAEFILCVINAPLNRSWTWVILIGLLMVYAYAILRLTIRNPVTYRVKTVLLALLAFLLLVFIDFAMGFHGWSFNYVYPAMLVILELIAAFYIIVNRSNFQSYIPIQIFLIFLACVPFILHVLHLFETFRVDVAVLIFTVLVYILTMLLGGRRARSELLRRFHI